LKRSQNAFFGDFSSFRPFFSINRYGESNDTDVFVDYFENVDDHHFEETVYDSFEIDFDDTEIDIEIVYESVHTKIDHTKIDHTKIDHIENIDQSSEDHRDYDEIYDQIIDARASLVGFVHRW
jgi:uncharacterized protein YjdB